MSKYMTIEEVADLYGVSERTVRNWINEDKLEAERVGGRLIRILPSSLEALSEPIHRRANLRR